MNRDVLVRIIKAGGFFEFSSRQDGNMKISGGGRASENRKIFIRKNFPRYTALRLAKVNHGTEVAIVGKSVRSTSFEADALLTMDPKVAIAVTFADCPPVLLFNRQERVIGSIHCSYRTVLDDIIAKTAKAAMELKAYPDDFLAVIGPGICKECYEIKSDVLHLYAGYEDHIIAHEGKMLANLKGIIKKKMEHIGILPKNIFDVGMCTCCHREGGRPAFFSARREKMRPPHIKAGMAAICLER